MNKQTADALKLIKEQDAGDADLLQVRQQFEEAMEEVAFLRFRICIVILLCLYAFLGVLDYATFTFKSLDFPFLNRVSIVGVLGIYLLLSYVPQFKKNTYPFTFLLSIMIGVFNSSIVFQKGALAIDHYMIYALIFSIMGLVMPWGGKTLASIFLPVYLFYPISLALSKTEITSHFFIKSNIYLLLFLVIVAIGAEINENFHFQDFLLKKRMERINLVLEDYQKRLKRSYQRVEQLAILDPLTGVYNRSYLRQWLTTEIHKKKTGSNFFSIVMYDLDQFKEINDQAGHQMGDRILQRLTEVVQEAVGEDNLIFRYGGDEFVLILMGFDLQSGVRTAEKVRKQIETHPDLLVKFTPLQSFHVTASLGVITEYLSGTIDADYLIRWVDAALLESKRQGRNCIHVFHPEERKIISAKPWLTEPA